MFRDHPSQEMFCAYVSGELVGSRCAEFESHVDTCASCARALQRAAALELALHEAARQLKPSRRLGAPTQHAASLAAMAAAVLFMISGTPASERVRSEPSSASALRFVDAPGPVCVAPTFGELESRCDDVVVALASFPEDEDALVSEELVCSVDDVVEG